MIRRTKIVATLGPACSDAKTLDRMMEAGIDVVRLNFSHGTAQDHIDRAELVRSLARARGRAVGVLVDLQGPKIRIGKFKDGKITLAKGDTFILDAACTLGDQTRVGLDYKELPNDVKRGVTLLLDDGRIELWVEEVKGTEIICKVVQGGVLSNNKGINRKGGGLSAAALTEKDIEDIKTAAALKADYLAVSFPRSGADMRQARELLRAAGGKSQLVAKIERAEAIEHLEEILEASDAIMVARGDLGVEVGDAAVPALQKRMIRMAIERNKVVITATQMMESMISSPIPTRAEVSDVANAVLDGTDAVMLSAETAAGQYPGRGDAGDGPRLSGSRKGSRTGFSGDAARPQLPARRRGDRDVGGVHLGAPQHQGDCRADRVRQHLPVDEPPVDPGADLRLDTRRSKPVEKSLFSAAFIPINLKTATKDRDALLAEAEEELRRRGAVRDGDLILLTIGEPIGQSGGTNTMKIVRVGDSKKT